MRCDLCQALDPLAQDEQMLTHLRARKCLPKGWQINAAWALSTAC